jgi:ABC-type uncharacterized transport system ATPase subunit
MNPILRMEGITKRFGSTLANYKIDFACYQGEIISLLGENGAGKTTLMKILYGMYKADEGKIYLRDRELILNSPRKAIEMGIQMVHQHFMLVPTLTVADNVVMGKEPKKGLLYDAQKAETLVGKLSKEYGLRIMPNKLINELSVGEQQRVEIIKALYQGAEVLILDEPTAVLTPQETDELFQIMRELKAAGKTIIIITHKLRETMEISDRVYVLRGGKLAGVLKKSETNSAKLGELMVGRKLKAVVREKLAIGRKILETVNLTLMDQQKQKQLLNSISIHVHSAEILGIAGVEGNGQMELIAVLSGMNGKWSGELIIDGKSMKNKKTNDFFEAGVACIHADRHRHGLVLDLPISENILLGYQRQAVFHRRKGLLNWPKIHKKAKELLQTFDVRPQNIDLLAGRFSGGNQQKIVVARELNRDPKFIIAAHPTRGLDIGATEFIQNKLNEMKKRGAGILLISSDLDELMQLSDRIAVLFEGKIVAVNYTEAFTKAELGLLMGGGMVNAAKAI